MNYSTDILIIGGGISAAMAAIQSSKFGLKVALIDKGMLGRSGLSATTGGGICAAKTKPDTYQTHLNDAVRIGTINDAKITEIMTREAPKRLEEIEEIGVRMHIDGSGNLYQIGGPTFTYPRIALVIGGGYSLTETMRKEVFHRGVSVIEDTMVLEIVVIDNRAVGAIGIYKITGDLCEIRAKAVILAAGGAEGIYKYVSSNYVCTGDSYVLAFQAGAKLANMEFQEFGLVPCPNGVITPAAGIGELLNNGALIYAESGKTIPSLYPNKSFIVGMYEETFVKGSRVYLDATGLTHEKLLKFSSASLMAAKLREGNVDFWDSPKFEIIPALRKFYGGVMISSDCSTGIDGLFAAGECTTGSQGARRLEGDGIGGALVFGDLASKSAVIYVKRHNPPLTEFTERMESLKCRLPQISHKGTKSVYNLKMQLRENMWNNLGILRNKEKISHAIEELSNMEQELDSTTQIQNVDDLIGLLELKNMLLTSEMVSKAALIREESRGFHHRTDFPEQDDKNWLKWIVMTRKTKDAYDYEISLEVSEISNSSKLVATEQLGKQVGYDMVGD